MKHTLFIILLSSTLFANYNFNTNNSAKIDMHGGKSDSLLSSDSNLSKPKINPLNNMKMPQAFKPSIPKSLLKEKEQKKELK